MAACVFRRLLLFRCWLRWGQFIFLLLILLVKMMTGRVSRLVPRIHLQPLFTALQQCIYHRCRTKCLFTIVHRYIYHLCTTKYFLFFLLFLLFYIFFYYFCVILLLYNNIFTIFIYKKCLFSHLYYLVSFCTIVQENIDFHKTEQFSAT